MANVRLSPTYAAWTTKLILPQHPNDSRVRRALAGPQNHGLLPQHPQPPSSAAQTCIEIDFLRLSRALRLSKHSLHLNLPTVRARERIQTHVFAFDTNGGQCLDEKTRSYEAIDA